MKDTYANYFIKAFIPKLNSEQRIGLLFQISIANNACSETGIYPLQTFIDSMKTMEEKSLFLHLLQKENKLKNIFFNQHAIHFVQKIMDTYKEDEVCFIHDYMLKNFYSVATSKIASTCLKAIISNLKQEVLISAVNSQLVRHLNSNLIFDKIGYTVYKLSLETFPFPIIKELVSGLIEDLVKFSLDKNSSEVIMCCFSIGPADVIYITI